MSGPVSRPLIRGVHHTDATPLADRRSIRPFHHHVEGACGHRWTLPLAQRSISAHRLLCFRCATGVRWEYGPEGVTRPEPPPARHCTSCGCRLRATNPEALCAPCDARERAAIAAAAPLIPDAADRDDVRDALRFIADMEASGVKATKTRYDLRRRRHGLLSATSLSNLLERPWKGVVDHAITHHNTDQEAA